MLFRQLHRLHGTSDPCNGRHVGGYWVSGGDIGVAGGNMLHLAGDRALKYDLAKFDHTLCHHHECHVPICFVIVWIYHYWSNTYLPFPPVSVKLEPIKEQSKSFMRILTLIQLPRMKNWQDQKMFILKLISLKVEWFCIKESWWFSVNSKFVPAQPRLCNYWQETPLRRKKEQLFDPNTRN